MATTARRPESSLVGGPCHMETGYGMSDAIPGVGLEVARFGETRTTLRERLGDYSSFTRSVGDAPTDHFVSSGLLLSFDGSDRLNFIEATARSEITLSGVSLCGRPFGEILNDFHRLGVEVELDDSGCSLPGRGISLYTPAPDELDVDVEGAALFPLEANRQSEEGNAVAEPVEPEDAGPAADTLF